MEPQAPMSASLRREQAALIAEIDAAFADVSREGGVSWSESRVIDNYGSMGEQLEARASDRDTHWRQLVDDENWRDDMGIGGWSFLDPIGFCYYLPAAMRRSAARGDGTDSMVFHLTYYGTESDALKAERHGLLNQRQRACIARFLRFMVESLKRWDELTVEEGWSASTEWQKSLDSHWHQYLPVE